MAGAAERAAAAACRQGLAFVDRAFESARRVAGSTVPCGRGCSACCGAVFEIGEGDALMLEEWLAARSGSERRALRERSSSVIAAIDGAARALARDDEGLSGWRAAEEPLSALPEEAAAALARTVGEACPLVGPEGECRAHSHRPAICRLQGLPWRDPETGTELADGCRLDARMADNPPAPLDLARLDALRHDCDEAIRATGRAPRRRLVAAVLAAAPDAGEGA